ncbi:hypothetical protein GCM10007977_030290 [Dactylosporangium sucinum]|uniref:Acyltransferase n=2 Tax=Dactylosporangium sucinum TaxID=1424081 RepID=A0A917TKX8_9ACTN|nr:hypothetical protein GCM10007977_030290 [Dactylosporangium sucinum]
MTAGPYPPSMIGLSDVPVSNLAPPTGALVALAVAQFAAISWLGRRCEPALATDRWRRFLDDGNAPLMTVYLWHLPAMVLLVGAGLLLPDLILPDAGLHWWLIRPLWLANCALILVVLTRLWHRFETVRLPALGTRTGPATALAGTGLAAASIWYLWQHGATLNGAGSAGRIAAVLALGCSLVLLACGQPRTRRDAPVRGPELNVHPVRSGPAA